MKLQTLLLLALLLAGFSSFAQNNVNAEITYINNEGFMIKNNDKKIFIDALYYYSSGAGIPNTSQSILDQIMNNKQPFENSQLHLVTHNHPDHYSETMMSNYLTNNPNSTFIGEPSMTNSLKSKFTQQICSLKPAKSERIDTVVNGFPLSAFNLIHDTGYRIYNVGYLINIDGLTIFHTGDNSLDEPEEYLSYNIEDIPIDIAFINHNTLLKNSDNSQFFKEHLNARYIILMHIPETQIEATMQKVAALGEGFPPIIVFSSSMESVMLTDTMRFTNHTPKTIGSVADTTLALNKSVEIKIPDLFSDPDENDSVSYSATGLPSGLVFNNSTMSVSGTPEKAGKSTVRIIGTDKKGSPNFIQFKIKIEDKTDINLEKTGSNVIYPNPASDYIWSDLFTGENTSITIYNMQGSSVIKTQAATNPLNISTLQKGIYMVCLEENGKYTSNRLIKE